MSVRQASKNDLDFIVALADDKRREYEQYAPVFHRPAHDARNVHRPWLADLIESDRAAVLVSEGEDDACHGFVIATLVPSPPVYDPGGPTCSIDDFAVMTATHWASAGHDLLQAAQAWGREQGAVQTVVVCGPHDGPKRQMLTDSGLEVVSEWFTAPLSP